MNDFLSPYPQIAAMVGTVLAFGSMPLLASSFGEISGELRGWSYAGIVLGSVGGGALLISLLGSREKREFGLEEPLSFIDSFKTTLSNRTFLTFVGADLMLSFRGGWLMAILPFFIKYVVCVGKTEMSILFLAVIVSAMAIFPLWRKTTIRYGSKSTLTLAMVLSVAFLFPLLIITSFMHALMIAILLGAAISGTFLIRLIVLSDVIDEDEIKTGLRREGAYLGTNTFIGSFSLVLVGISAPLVLGFSGYDPALTTQPLSVALGIKLGMVLIPLVALSVFPISFKYYPLNKERVIEMRRKLDRLHEEKLRKLKEK